MRRNDAAVTAICDLDPFMIDSALNIIDEAGRPKPQVYTGNDYAWREMYVRADIDAVFIVTPWEWHALQAIEAMRARIAVACEVVAGITLEDHWDVLFTQQETGTPYMLLENVCYRRDVLAVLNMARQGLFGEIVHLEGYEHDLRPVKFNSGVPGRAYGGGVEFGDKGWSEAKWRTPHSVTRNGDLYPSRGIGPCAMQANITGEIALSASPRRPCLCRSPAAWRADAHRYLRRGDLERHHSTVGASIAQGNKTLEFTDFTGGQCCLCKLCWRDPLSGVVRSPRTSNAMHGAMAGYIGGDPTMR